MSDVLFSLNLEEEDIMKKLGYIVAAVAAIAIAAPTVASAEKIVIKRGGHHDGARAEFRHGDRDRGWHRGHDRKVVIIKHGRDRRY
jgi:Ni/Co efflux regulator RcnB